MNNQHDPVGRKNFLETEVHGAISSKNNPTDSPPIWYSGVAQARSAINHHNIAVDCVGRVGGIQSER
jgi:hypothetical protein